MPVPAPKLLWLLLPAALVVWIFTWEREHTPAPPLSLAHAREPELQGSHACEACHGDWEGSAGMRRACIVCHGGIGTDLDLKVGLHGARVEGGVQDCTRCHIEHAGRDFPLVGEMSFREAGFDSMAAFAHQGLKPGGPEYALDGAHDGLECKECHEQALAVVLAKGQQRFRGLTQVCEACHDDPHGDQFPDTAACSNCHGQAHFVPARFGFEAHANSDFPLEGAHRAVACNACHEVPEGEPASARQWTGVVRACDACHPDPHFGIFEGTNLPALVKGGATCARCHGLDSFAKLLVGPPEEFDHDFWTGSDTMSQHSKQTCDDCHAPLATLARLEPGMERRGRTRSAAFGRTCAACHADEHRGQFQTPATAACEACHASQSNFAVLDFDHNTDSRFALDAVHRDVACGACHGRVVWPDGSSAVRYKSLGMQCADCHVAGGRKSRAGERAR